ncbi:unnamed protein product [Blepharisma stoltei]|uniref:UBA domain-containing protein n=1 Tax=Blepharisma stoltei TaxID=1481888 RepID=A0AAU9JXU2_9CILI|nr:unnamed protein product [Blepharisma stoltei]
MLFLIYIFLPSWQTPASYRKKHNALVNFGFNEEGARRALRLCGGDVDQAFSFLLLLEERGLECEDVDESEDEDESEEAEDVYEIYEDDDPEFADTSISETKDFGCTKEDLNDEEWYGVDGDIIDADGKEEKNNGIE